MKHRDVHVTYSHKKPPYWEVTHRDGRWWSVAYNDFKAHYLITNRVGRVLDQWGPTGQKVLDAVHDFERNT
jgi:hypothetical protein